MDNAAAICNPRGNVMAIMPHPERAPAALMPGIFISMRKTMEARQANLNFDAQNVPPDFDFTDNTPALETHAHIDQTIEFFVQLKITDNEAQTLENALRQHGFDVHLRKWKYFEVDIKESTSFASGETENPEVRWATQDGIRNGLLGQLHNHNKERIESMCDGEDRPVDLKKNGAHYFLVIDKEDVVGMKLSKELNFPTRHGIVWEVTTDPDYILDEAALLATNVFANHHAQLLERLA
jgi:phosphoribosylformylglycinamidine synthase